MNLSSQQLFIIGMTINLIAGNAFFTYFGILNMQTWHAWDSSFLILGGFFVGVFTSFQAHSMAISSVTDIGMSFSVNLLFGIVACFMFSFIIIPVGIVNGFWFMAMKRAKIQEQKRVSSQY